MILYYEIAKPDLAHSRFNVDFGHGFYVTLLYEQGFISSFVMAFLICTV